MMDLAVMQEAIRQAVLTCTELDDERVQWVNTAIAGTWRAWPCADLVLSGPIRRGYDSRVREYDSGPDAVTTTQYGARELNVSVRIETENQEPGSSAHVYAGMLQTRLQRVSVRDALHAAGLALATNQKPVTMDFKSDDRMISLCVLDLVFNAAEVDVDTTASGDFIEQVTLESDTLDEPDGDPSPIQIDLTVPEEL